MGHRLVRAWTWLQDMVELVLVGLWGTGCLLVAVFIGLSFVIGASILLTIIRSAILEAFDAAR